MVSICERSLGIGLQREGSTKPNEGRETRLEEVGTALQLFCFVFFFCGILV